MRKVLSSNPIIVRVVVCVVFQFKSGWGGGSGYEESRWTACLAVAKRKHCAPQDKVKLVACRHLVWMQTLCHLHQAVPSAAVDHRTIKHILPTTAFFLF